MAFRCPPELLLRTAIRVGNSARFSQTAATIPDTYSVAVCKELGKPLEFVKKQQSQLTNNQVRLAVKHAAINFSDILLIEGKYQAKPPLPFMPGAEFSGEVIDIGPQVSHVRPGDHVVCVTTNLPGAFAEQAVVSSDSCFKIDTRGGKSLSEAAAMIISYGTAQLSLVRRANIKSSDTVLVTAAAGALGLAAVDLAANVYGATVIGACGGPEKCEIVKKYGAKFTIDYNKENVREKLKEITKGKGVDIIFDVVGGQILEDGLKNIAYEGRVLTLGYAGGDIPKIPANILLVKNFSVIGVFWGSYRERMPEVFQDSVNEVIRLWSAGKIRPHTSESFPLMKVNDAIAYIKQRRSTGKVILDCSQN